MNMILRRITGGDENIEDPNFIILKHNMMSWLFVHEYLCRQVAG